MTTIKRTEVKTYLEKLYCECGGQMLPYGYVLTTHPPQYPHKCEQCGKTTIESQPFPRITYDEGDSHD